MFKFLSEINNIESISVVPKICFVLFETRCHYDAQAGCTQTQDPPSLAFYKLSLLHELSHPPHYSLVAKAGWGVTLKDFTPFHHSYRYY